MSFISIALDECRRPWKLATFAIGLGLLIVGSFVFPAPDWDIPISIIMAGFTYLTAGWSMHVVVERRWRDWPLMLFLTWWCVDGCYVLYWWLIDPQALELMRDANWPASLSLYWACGLVWFWNGTLRELLKASLSILILGILLVAMPSDSYSSDTTSERLAYAARGEAIELAGELTIPEGRDGRLPAIIVVHGSSGKGRREAGWAEFFQQHGYATFVIDYFSPRGITSKSPTQPTPVGDVFQALVRLAEHPRIDPTRIAVIGFSRGAVMSVDASNDGGRSTGGISASVYIAMYPGCRRGYINNDPTLPPLLILLGTEDSYTTPGECQRLVTGGVSKGRTVELKIYEGATHAWDAGFDGTFYHQAANRTVTIQSSQEFTERSRSDVIAFLSQSLQRRSTPVKSASGVKDD